MLIQVFLMVSLSDDMLTCVFILQVVQPLPSEYRFLDTLRVTSSSDPLLAHGHD